METPITVETWEIVSAVVLMLLTGFAALWKVIIYILNKQAEAIDAIYKRIDRERNSIQDKVSERNKDLHDKIDGKTDHLSGVFRERIDDINVVVRRNEDNYREDIRAVNSRIDEVLMKKFETNGSS